MSCCPGAVVTAKGDGTAVTAKGDGAAVTAKGDGKDFASAASAKGDAGNPSSAETAEGDQRLQIAAMIRSDVLRECRARKTNSIPGPTEFYRVVNYAVAQHLADVPVALPDLTEVLAEVARSDVMSDALCPKRF